MPKMLYHENLIIFDQVKHFGRYPNIKGMVNIFKISVTWYYGAKINIDVKLKKNS